MRIIETIYKIFIYMFRHDTKTKLIFAKTNEKDNETDKYTHMFGIFILAKIRKIQINTRGYYTYALEFIADTRNPDK